MDFSDTSSLSNLLSSMGLLPEQPGELQPQQVVGETHRAQLQPQQVVEQGWGHTTLANLPWSEELSFSGPSPVEAAHAPTAAGAAPPPPTSTAAPPHPPASTAAGVTLQASVATGAPPPAPTAAAGVLPYLSTAGEAPSAQAVAGGPGAGLLQAATAASAQRPVFDLSDLGSGSWFSQLQPKSTNPPAPWPQLQPQPAGPPAPLFDLSEFGSESGSGSWLPSGPPPPPEQLFDLSDLPRSLASLMHELRQPLPVILEGSSSSSASITSLLPTRPTAAGQVIEGSSSSSTSVSSLLPAKPSVTGQAVEGSSSSSTSASLLLPPNPAAAGQAVNPGPVQQQQQPASEAWWDGGQEVQQRQQKSASEAWWDGGQVVDPTPAQPLGPGGVTLPAWPAQPTTTTWAGLDPDPYPELDPAPPAWTSAQPATTTRAGPDPDLSAWPSAQPAATMPGTNPDPGPDPDAELDPDSDPRTAPELGVWASLSGPSLAQALEGVRAQGPAGPSGPGEAEEDDDFTLSDSLDLASLRATSLGGAPQAWGGGRGGGRSGL